MKNFTKLLMFCSLFWAFSSLAQTTETEPNNGFTEANDVTFDTDVKGAIAVRNDVDFYKITLTKPTVVAISVEGIASNQYMYIEMFDSSQKRLGVAESDYGKNVYYNQLQCATGTYYIKLSTYNGAASASQYIMKVQADVKDVYECNQSFNEAKEIAINSELKASINSQGDVDFYKVTIDKPSVIDVSVEGLASNQYMYIEMFDASQKRLGVAESDYGKNVYYSQLQCAAGTYYIKLSTYNGAASASQYTMKVKADISDIYECNQDLNQAKEIAINSELKASINSRGDVDFYKIILTKPTVVDISVEGLASNQYMYIEMFDASQKRLGVAESDYGKNVYYNQLQCTAGTYYIKLSTYNGAASASQYTMKVKADVSDIYECNQSFNEAKEIAFDKEIKASINSTGDVDFYKITLLKPTVINVSVEDLASNQYMYIEMFDVSQKRLGVAESGYGKNVYYNQLQCAAGTYYIKLSTYNGAASASQYTMKVQADVSDIYECNNSFADAKEIALRTVIKAAINSSGDEDFFKFTLANKTTLNMNLREIPTGMTAYMDLYSQTQNFLRRGTNVTNTSSIQKIALDPGTYFVKIFASGSNANLYTLSVAPDTLLPPKISANKLAVCPGGDVTLIASECTGIVKWSTNATGLSITVKPIVNTTYTATCEDGGKTSASSQPLTITMNPIPNATATATNNGNYYETQTISLSASGGNAYRWAGPNNFVSTQQNAQIVNAKVGNSGEYKVTVTNMEGCSAIASITIKVELITAITNEPFSTELKATVYPNPSSGIFIVEVIPRTGHSTDVQLQVVDKLGRILWQKQLLNVSKSQKEQINLLPQATGTYFLQVQASQEQLNKTIILIK